MNQAVPIPAGNSMPGSSAPMGMGGIPGGQKHGANAYDNTDRDGYYKRPRVEVYANALTSDIDSYRKQHEVTALVSWFVELDFFFSMLVQFNELGSHFIFVRKREI